MCSYSSTHVHQLWGQGQIGPTSGPTREYPAHHIFIMVLCLHKMHMSPVAGGARDGVCSRNDLEDSSAGQPGQPGQTEDLLAAWRQLSDIDSILPGALGTATLADIAGSPQVEDELARLTHAQLAAPWDSVQDHMLTVPTDDLMTDPYMAPTWDASDSPQMLMGSPNQNLQQYFLYPDHKAGMPSKDFTEPPDQLPQHNRWSPASTEAAAGTKQREYFPKSPEHLPQHSRWSAALPESVSGAAHSLSLLPEHRQSSTSLPDHPLEQPIQTRLPAIDRAAVLRPTLQVQIDLEAGDIEQGSVKPSEKDLYAMMARFQDNCSQLPAVVSANSDDLVATSAPCEQPSQQDHAAASHGFDSVTLEGQNNASKAAPEQQTSGSGDESGTAHEAVQHSSAKSEMYMDSLEPDEAEHAPLAHLGQDMGRLATCSDDEDFPVLDFGPGSDASSECSYGVERTAADFDNSYAAPK